MNYEKKYKEALERARELSQTTTGARYEYIFPELKESEDERIRRVIRGWIYTRPASFFDNGISKEEMLAWLEKQKEFVSVDFDDVWKTADCDELTAPLEKYSKDAIKEMSHAWYDKGIELERKSCLKKQGEQKSADKVEPKFKVGDWIISNDKKSTYQVIEVKRGIYVIRDNADNHEYYIGIEACERSGRLWNISDAKPGDVLYSPCCKLLWIYKDDNSCYVGHNLSYSENCVVVNSPICIPSDVCPATKEQRDTLMKAMVNAGYTFDFEKKEPKKIEQKPAWSEEDEEELGIAIEYLQRAGQWSSATWLKSLKDRVHPQNRWKPSYEQIEVLQKSIKAYNEVSFPTEVRVLSSLCNELKKL